MIHILPFSLSLSVDPTFVLLVGWTWHASPLFSLLVNRQVERWCSERSSDGKRKWEKLTLTSRFSCPLFFVKLYLTTTPFFFLQVGIWMRWKMIVSWRAKWLKDQVTWDSVYISHFLFLSPRTFDELGFKDNLSKMIAHRKRKWESWKVCMSKITSDPRVALPPPPLSLGGKIDRPRKLM